MLIDGNDVKDSSVPMIPVTYVRKDSLRTRNGSVLQREREIKHEVRLALKEENQMSKNGKLEWDNNFAGTPDNIADPQAFPNMQQVANYVFNALHLVPEWSARAAAMSDVQRTVTRHSVAELAPRRWRRRSTEYSKP